jgi:hypothetical protein
VCLVLQDRQDLRLSLNFVRIIVRSLSMAKAGSQQAALVHQKLDDVVDAIVLAQACHDVRTVTARGLEVRLVELQIDAHMGGQIRLVGDKEVGAGNAGAPLAGAPLRSYGESSGSRGSSVPGRLVASGVRLYVTKGVSVLPLRGQRPAVGEPRSP